MVLMQPEGEAETNVKGLQAIWDKVMHRPRQKPARPYRRRAAPATMRRLHPDPSGFCPEPFGHQHPPAGKGQIRYATDTKSVAAFLVELQLGRHLVFTQRAEKRHAVIHRYRFIISSVMPLDSSGYQIAISGQRTPVAARS